MTLRTDRTTSERQLILALAESGRHVSRVQLAGWRKEGLMPPLANRGLGPARGKSYHWNEDNIIAQAQCVHDLLAQHSRPAAAALTLWLCGYPVALVRVRRALLQRAKRPQTWQLRNASVVGKPHSLMWRHSPAQNRADAIILKAVLTLCGSFTAGQRSESQAFYEALRRASEVLGYAAETTDVEYRVFNTFSVVLSAIEGSSFINTASEEDMVSARYLTAAGVRLIQTLTSENHESACPVELARLMEVLGAPIFLCALLLQKTGYDKHLSKSFAALETAQATISQDTLSERTQFLKSFRSQLAQIWSAAPTEPRHLRPDLVLTSGAPGPMSSLGLFFGFVLDLPARFCTNDGINMLPAIPV